MIRGCRRSNERGTKVRQESGETDGAGRGGRGGSLIRFLRYLPAKPDHVGAVKNTENFSNLSTPSPRCFCLGLFSTRERNSSRRTVSQISAHSRLAKRAAHSFWSAHSLTFTYGDGRGVGDGIKTMKYEDVGINFRICETRKNCMRDLNSEMEEDKLKGKRKKEESHLTIFIYNVNKVGRANETRKPCNSYSITVDISDNVLH